jgi:hypothetical protein
MNVAIEKITAFLPPEKSFGGSECPASAEASSWIGSEVDMMLSSSDAYCSIRFAGCDDARRWTTTRPTAAADMDNILRREM